MGGRRTLRVLGAPAPPLPSAACVSRCWGGAAFAESLARWGQRPSRAGETRRPVEGCSRGGPTLGPGRPLARRSREMLRPASGRLPSGNTFSRRPGRGARLTGALFPPPSRTGEAESLKVSGGVGSLEEPDPLHCFFGGGGFPCLLPPRRRVRRAFCWRGSATRQSSPQGSACPGRLAGLGAISLPRPALLPGSVPFLRPGRRNIRRLDFGAAASRLAAGCREAAGGGGRPGSPTGLSPKALPAPETRGGGFGLSSVKHICSLPFLAGCPVPAPPLPHLGRLAGRFSSWIS